MEALLRVRGVDSATITGRITGRTARGRSLPAKIKRDKTREAISLIRLNTIPELFSRIPEHARSDPNSLLRSLETEVWRFRFFDLPAEIRNRIYGFILAPSDCMILIDVLGRKITPYPVIIQTSLQLRQEALPLFEKLVVFALVLGIPEHDVRNVRSIVLGWVEKASRLQLDRLRIVMVNKLLPFVAPRQGRAPLSLTFTYGVNKGLKVEVEGYGRQLTRVSDSRLRRHLQDLTDTCKTLDLHDRALILLFSSSSRLWEDGGLLLRP